MPTTQWRLYRWLTFSARFYLLSFWRESFLGGTRHAIPLYPGFRRTVSPMMDTVDGCQVPTTAMGFRRWLLFEARFHRLVSSGLDAEIERCAAPRRRNTRLCGTLRSARAPQCLYYRRFCVRRARTWPNFSLRSPGAVGNRFARVKESQTRICSLLVFRVLWCTRICWCMTVNTFLVSTCVSSCTVLLDKLCFRVFILTNQLW